MFADADPPEYTTIESTPPTRDDLYLTSEELAARLRVDPTHLANMRHKGEGLPWTKVGNRALYKVADVLAAETAGARGYSRARLVSALETYGPLRKLTTAEREKLLVHITEVFKG